MSARYDWSTPFALLPHWQKSERSASVSKMRWELAHTGYVQGIMHLEPDEVQQVLDRRLLAEVEAAAWALLGKDLDNDAQD